TRLADYMYQCICYLAREHDVSVIAVRYRPDKLASYDFLEHQNVTLLFYDETDLSPEWLESINPVAIFSSSWGDKRYLKVALAWKNRVPLIVGLDNPWKNTVKQRINSRISALTVRKYFNKIWVAGPQQFTYAVKLGFSYNDIIQGVYSADDEKFTCKEKVLDNTDSLTLLFVGRLVDYKRPLLLAELFNEIQTEEPALNIWKLKIVGSGPQESSIREISNPNISVSGFTDPSQLPSLYNEASVFCLPSVGEHWGVVVHEAALCGLPLLLSDSVSASSALLIDGYNGFLFATSSRDSFKENLRKIMHCSIAEIHEMGQRSSQMAKAFSKELWAARLLSVLN
ncbi:MAG TPA: glycosyltransferase family 4 protein, partial [Parasegetibacter sp.]